MQPETMPKPASVRDRGMAKRCWALLLFALLLIPAASAELSMDERRLNLVCNAGDCTLSNDAAGDAMISAEERNANPAQPVTVRLEFQLRPDQVSVALLPTVMETLEIDLRIAEDGLGITRPDVYVELILGPSFNDWTLPAPSASLGAQSPYRLDNADLDLSNGRILGPGDQVLLRIEFDISNPVTWELYLAGDSFLELPIIWSLDAEAANVDEPTSISEPKEISLIGSTTFGGLMGADVDCFRLDVSANLASVTVIISWAATPIEVEQAHTIPVMRDGSDKAVDEPEIRTRYEGESVVDELRFIEPEGGEYTLCWTGAEDRYQSYSFTGRTAMLGIGATTPEEFTGEATWDGGITQVGRVSEASTPAGAGVFTMGVAAAGIIIALGGYLVPLSSPWLPRFMLPMAMILLLVGGIISPAVSISNETQNPGEMTFDDLLDERINRIHQGIINNDEGVYGPQHYGGFLGAVDGERLQFMLTIESTHPLGDGRWQIQVEELESVDFDKLVFGKLQEARLSDENEVRFILRTGRLMALDLILLESLLIVDAEPTGDILHVDWTMTTAPGIGSLSAPAWTTRPDSIPADDWAKLTAAVLPELLSVSFCDCGIDAMELSIRPSEVYANDLILPGGLVTSDGMIPHDFWVAMTGLFVLASAGYVEKARRDEASVIAGRFFD
jgi:hypothetical protein